MPYTLFRANHTCRKGGWGGGKGEGFLHKAWSLGLGGATGSQLGAWKPFGGLFWVAGACPSLLPARLPPVHPRPTHLVLDLAGSLSHIRAAGQRVERVVLLGGELELAVAAKLRLAPRRALEVEQLGNRARGCGRRGDGRQEVGLRCEALLVLVRLARGRRGGGDGRPLC